MTSIRIEQDSMGSVEVAAERLWGAQTQRSLANFRISTERMPRQVIDALCKLKTVSALTNAELGLLPEPMAQAIAAAADEVLDGQHPDEFPLLVWQTGSGTQTHMNVNEVLANRASELLGGERGDQRLVHPNDHVNLGQSSNDVFASAMNMAAVETLGELTPAVEQLARTVEEKAERFARVVKIGRTHLQDATPLTVGQEFGSWCAQLRHSMVHLSSALPHLQELPLGGTAVGTGLNAHPEFSARAIARLNDRCKTAFRPCPNSFEAIAAHDALVFAHGALKTLATALTKLANDVRWLASGPRCGLGELKLPQNEPGSSIMPGKVNPTQCEALIMCCIQVLGNDVAINVAGGSGNLQLNVARPLMIHAFVQSARLLRDGIRSFCDHAMAGIEVDEARITQHLQQSLMLVTALSPHIGYDGAAAIAKRAYRDGTTLKAAALAEGSISESDFDRWVVPDAMLGNAPRSGH